MKVNGCFELKIKKAGAADYYEPAFLIAHLKISGTLRAYPDSRIQSPAIESGYRPFGWIFHGKHEISKLSQSAKFESGIFRF